MRSTSTKLAALGAVAALGFAGAACASGDDGSTSPGQEAPAGDTGGDLGTGGETGTDTGLSEDGTGAGLGSSETTTP